MHAQKKICSGVRWAGSHLENQDRFESKYISGVWRALGIVSLTRFAV